MKVYMYIIFCLVIQSCESEIKERFENGKLKKVCSINFKGNKSCSEYDSLTENLTRRYSIDKNGLLDGEFTKFDDNGSTVLLKLNFKSGKKDGLGILFNNDGEVIRKVNYKNNYLNGPSFEFDGGKLIKEMCYINDTLTWNMSFNENHITEIYVKSIVEKIFQNDSLRISFKSLIPNLFDYNDLKLNIIITNLDTKKQVYKGSKQYSKKHLLFSLEKVPIGKYILESGTYFRKVPKGSEFNLSETVDTIFVSENGLIERKRHEYIKLRY